MAVRDKIHFDFREVDSFNRVFNFIISEREPGKTTTAILDKVYLPFKKDGKTAIWLVRRSVELTPALFESWQMILQKFIDETIVFKYSKAELKTGCVDLFINEKRIIRVIALSLPMDRIKKLVVTNPGNIIFDEFIANLRHGERYLKDEYFTFKEVYTTFNRESTKPIKCYFLGNPYSLFNPYFVGLQLDTSLLKRGTIITGSNWLVNCYEMKPELREAILKKNPLFEFDDSYTKYAFGGIAVHDSNIRIRTKKPTNYFLRFTLKFSDKIVGVWENNIYDKSNIFYANVLTQEISKQRAVICFDFADLVDRTILFSPEDKIRFKRLKRAIEQRAIEFESIECYYLIEGIYNQL